MTEVLTCGETMAVLRGPGPLRLGGSLELSVAGAESNVAIGLARLGHQAGWVGRVGADAEKMLSGFRAGAARDREELRADPGAQGAQP